MLDGDPRLLANGDQDRVTQRSLDSGQKSKRHHLGDLLIVIKLQRSCEPLQFILKRHRLHETGKQAQSGKPIIRRGLQGHDRLGELLLKLDVRLTNTIYWYC